MVFLGSRAGVFFRLWQENLSPSCRLKIDFPVGDFWCTFILALSIDSILVRISGYSAWPLSFDDTLLLPLLGSRFYSKFFFVAMGL